MKTSKRILSLALTCLLLLSCATLAGAASDVFDNPLWVDTVEFVSDGISVSATIDHGKGEIYAEVGDNQPVLYLQAGAPDAQLELAAMASGEIVLYDGNGIPLQLTEGESQFLLTLTNEDEQKEYTVIVDCSFLAEEITVESDEAAPEITYLWSQIFMVDDVNSWNDGDCDDDRIRRIGTTYSEDDDVYYESVYPDGPFAKPSFLLYVNSGVVSIKIKNSSGGEINWTRTGALDSIAYPTYRITETLPLEPGKNWFIIEEENSFNGIQSKRVLIELYDDTPDLDPPAPDPVSKTGWAQIHGKWIYYLNNVRQVNAWVQDSKGWLYIGLDGYLVTDGWASDSGGWYYMDSSGYISTNKWVKDSVGWYYMGGNGRMLTAQWLEWNGDWYYLQANGLMATSTITIDGKQQKFDSSGRWIGAA